MTLVLIIMTCAAIYACGFLKGQAEHNRACRASRDGHPVTTLERWRREHGG